MSSGNHYFSCQELIDKYPKVFENFGWTAQTVGYLLSAELLSGKYSHTEKKNLINEKSFLELVEFMDQRSKNRITNYGKAN